METAWLEEAGLTEGEAKTYLALLELGSSTTGDIVKKAGVSKSIIYQILDNLQEKGLVSYIIKDKTKHFQAADPTKILEYIEQRAAHIRETKQEVEQRIPELLERKEQAEESEARVYTGYKGIQTAHEHIYEKLDAGDTVYLMGIPEKQPKTQEIYWEKDVKRREEEGIRSKLLYNRDVKSEHIAHMSEYEHVAAQRMPTDIHTPAMFLIYSNVTTIVLQEPTPIAVEIVSSEISASFRAYFESFWNRQTRVYHGKEGAALVLDEIIEAGKRGETNYGFGTHENPYMKYMEEELEAFFEAEEEYDIDTRLLFMKGGEHRQPNAEVRYLPKEFMSPVRIMVYDDNVAMVDFTEPITSIIIEKEEVADAYKKHFEFLWKRAEE